MQHFSAVPDNVYIEVFTMVIRCVLTSFDDPFMSSQEQQLVDLIREVLKYSNLKTQPRIAGGWVGGICKECWIESVEVMRVLNWECWIESVEVMRVLEWECWSESVLKWECVESKWESVEVRVCWSESVLKWECAEVRVLKWACWSERVEVSEGELVGGFKISDSLCCVLVSFLCAICLCLCVVVLPS